MKPRIWASKRPPTPELFAPLSKLAEISVDGDQNLLAGSTVVISGQGRMFDGPWMDGVGPQLQLLAMPGIGLDHIDVPAATERGILVCNNPDAPTESTAEHTVGLLLAVAKRIVTGDMQLRGADISRSHLRGTEVLGRTLGVLGYGRIGRRVAEICALGLKMNVLVHDPYVDPDEEVEQGISFTSDMDALFSQADFVTLHTPLSAATHHLVGERQLRLMKRGSYLINASRGPVLDEAALIRVLQDGHLAGAGLDVFDPEPPLADNPLLRMSNVVLTPHTAPYTEAGVMAMWSGVASQISQFLRGERPAFLANPEAWPGRAGMKDYQA